MKISEKIKEKTKNICGAGAVTIAFLGDSVTQGCFECYTTSFDSLQTVFDYKSAYSSRLKEILNILYPSVQVNIVNAGISGDNAQNGVMRFERDIARFSPDLVVVSYGLNDACVGEKDGVSAYAQALKVLFEKSAEIGAERIFLTQNYMCEKTSPHLKEKLFIDLSEKFSRVQNEGILDEYYTVAKRVCKEQGVKVCDVRRVWRVLSENGADVTELLANKLNHPIREMHYYTAMKLLETMFEI